MAIGATLVIIIHYFKFSLNFLVILARIQCLSLSGYLSLPTVKYQNQRLVQLQESGGGPAAKCAVSVHSSSSSCLRQSIQRWPSHLWHRSLCAELSHSLSWELQSQHQVPILPSEASPPGALTLSPHHFPDLNSLLDSQDLDSDSKVAFMHFSKHKALFFNPVGKPVGCFTGSRCPKRQGGADEAVLFNLSLLCSRAEKQTKKKAGKTYLPSPRVLSMS